MCADHLYIPAFLPAGNDQSKVAKRLTWFNLAFMNPSLYAPSAGDLQIANEFYSPIF